MKEENKSWFYPISWSAGKSYSFREVKKVRKDKFSLDEINPKETFLYTEKDVILAFKLALESKERAERVVSYLNDASRLNDVLNVQVHSMAD